MQELLAFIRKPESGGDYNIVYGGIRREDRPRRPLTLMTIGDVLAWQDSIDARYPSEAAGAYQIMEDTLRGLYAEAGLTLNDRFSEENQDRLAVQLLKRRGLTRYQRGEITTEDFANSLAKEWASLPVVSGPKKGRSYYAGDGLNKSHVSVDDFLRAVASARPRPSVERPPAVAQRPQNPAIVLVVLLVAAVAFFGRKIRDWIKRRREA